MKKTNISLLDYSKISVIDMCYFLNGKADLTSNEYLKKFSPLLFSKVEMYEYIKFKTDNFDKNKFQLVFDEICDYCWVHMDFYRLEKVDGKFITSWGTDYQIDYSIESYKPLEFIKSTLSLNKGLIVNNNQIIDFIELAENLYKEYCKSTPNQQSQTKQFKTNLTDKQLGKLFDLLVQNGFIPDKDKEGFIWAFGGKNDNYTSYSTEWLQQSNLAVYLIDNVCIDNGKLWAIGSRIFGINNMAQIKQGYFSINKTGKPKGYQLIDTIISEAQK